MPPSLYLGAGRVPPGPLPFDELNPAVRIFRGRNLDLTAGTSGPVQVTERTGYFLKAELRKTDITPVTKLSYKLTFWYAPWVTGAVWTQCSNGVSAIEVAIDLVNLEMQTVGDSTTFWPVPDMAEAGPGGQAAYSLAAFIVPAAESNTLDPSSFYDPGLRPEVQSACAVRRIAIVGA